MAVHDEKSDRTLTTTETGMLVTRYSGDVPAELEKPTVCCTADPEADVVCGSYLYLKSTESPRHTPPGCDLHECAHMTMCVYL